MFAKTASSRPVLVVPARNPNEAFFQGGSDNATPSPMTIFSRFLAEHDPYADCKPFSQLFAGTLGSPTFSPIGGEPGFFNNLGNRGGVSDMPTGINLNEKLAGNGADGVAETHGHSPSNISPRYKAMMPSRLPVPCTTTYLTIPPGLSPTTLLESPVLFSTGLAYPSPTTGSFSIPPYAHERGLPIGAGVGKPEESNSEQNDSFVFKPHLSLGSTGLPPINGIGPFGIYYQQALEHGDGQEQSQLVPQQSCCAGMPSSDSTRGLASCPSFSIQKPQGPLESTVTTSFAESSEKALTSQVSVVAHHTPSCRERPSVDGYNWKKYGQKQLKGSEYPRSYYKCTHPNCSVKKHVERSHEGEVTEIMYKGEHNHAKPQATRRGARNGAHTLNSSERGAQLLVHESASEVSIAVRRTDSDRASADLSSSSLVLSHGGLTGTPEHSFGFRTDEEGEDGRASKVEDDGEDEQDSKRRRTENAQETSSSVPIRTIREPRVVVQTTSEVDILDDGYRWRKYGQKVVKGHHFPRSYYKCTNLGCAVRKNLERSSVDPKSVITTYEGKHNHNVPAARGTARETGRTAIVSATASPPLPAHAVIGGVSSANMVARPSVLLENEELAKFMEDRLTARSRMAVDMGCTSNSDYGRNLGRIHTSSVSAMSGDESELGQDEATRGW